MGVPRRWTLLWLLALAACSSEPQPADLRGLSRRTLTVGTHAFTIRVPEEARVGHESPPPDANAAVVDFCPGCRVDRSITLALPSEPETIRALPRFVTLRSGATLRYELYPDLGGGSGGTESALAGLLAFPAGPTLRVACHDQRELPPPDPRWCVPYLHHLALEPGPVGRGEGPEQAPRAASRDGCGWTPTGQTSPRQAFFARPAGCHLAAPAENGWRDVTQISPVSIELLPDRVRVQAVFLNAKQERVLPLGRAVTYDLRFQRRRQGRIVLRETMQRDGVFALDLPPEELPAACRLSLTVRFGNGRTGLRFDIDDWRHAC